MKITINESGCMMPSDISFKPDKTTKKLIRHIYQLEVYFLILRKSRGSTVDLCNNYLKILN
jgi:hypothetical protein